MHHPLCLGALIISSLVIWRKVIHSKVTHLGFRELLVEGLAGRVSHASACCEDLYAKRWIVSAGSLLPAQGLVNNLHIIHGLEATTKNCVWSWNAVMKQSKASHECCDYGVVLHAARCFALFQTSDL